MEITHKQEVNAILSRWDSLQPIQQMDLCAAAVKSFSKRVHPSIRNNLPKMTQDLIQETWLKLFERMNPAAIENAINKAEREGRHLPTLENLAYNAAAVAVRKYAGEVKEQMSRVDFVETEEGDTLNPLDIVEDERHATPGDLIRRPTEREAVDKLRLVEFMESRDQVDKAIVGDIRDGYTEREISCRLGTITQQAVNKRRRRLIRDLLCVGIAPSYYPAAV